MTVKFMRNVKDFVSRSHGFCYCEDHNIWFSSYCSLCESEKYLEVKEE